MSAEMLREAAKVLRERAEKATPGPWRDEYSKASGNCVLDAESRNALDSVARTMHYRAGLDARYIATMHPGVGLALSDLLEETAETWSFMGDPWSDADDVNPFVALASMILGSAS